MNVEFIEALNELCKTRRIKKEVLLEAIEQALMSAYKKNFDSASNARVTLDAITGEVAVYAQKKVVDQVENPQLEISVDNPAVGNKYQLGDIVEVEVTPRNFGRIAAQAAKQVIVQRIREAERGVIYDEYIEKEAEILTAIVLRIEGKTVYVDLNRTEGVLEPSQQMPDEEFHVGDRIKVYVMEVNRAQKGPQVMVSRTNAGLVKRLFEMEVPEIQTGVVQIKSIAREAGYRTKMAVYSTDNAVDPVGACVGQRGTRVETIVNELRGEKVDIIKWSSDPAEYIAQALSPAKVVGVFVNEHEKAAKVVVLDNQLSLAIGKEGQNARLAAKLTGWRIDIKSQSQAAQMFDMAMDEPAPEEPMGFQAYYEEPAPLEELRQSGLPELRDIPLDTDPDEDDTL